MKRLIALGLVFEVAVLIVGLTWFGEVPPADTGPAGPGSVAAAADGPAYRIYGEGTGRIVEVHLDAVETVQDIAEGVEYRVWTFGGTAPGPVIRVKVGDTVRFTLTNRSVMGLAHSIDFHAAETPWDVNYQPVAPGETLTFDWVARFPGVFMYHCGVPPVLHHIANGMYGAIVVEPEEGLAPAREYVLVASELYAADRAVDGVLEGDVAKMLAPRPTHVVFDGRANRYLDAPLQARPNETIRLWVVNAGPTLSNAFHVIGALFDHVYASGNPTTPLNGLQTWNIPPGDGAMFELRIPAEGLYPFVTHAFAYTGLGSVGVIQVTESAPEAPASYPVMGSPFDGGISEVVGTVDPDNLPGPSGPGGDTGTGGGGHDGSGETLVMDVAIGGFDPSEVSVKEGDVSIRFTNLDAFGHDFTIEELGLKVLLGPNETRTVTFTGSPGTYTFICSVPGHEEAGMVGTLTVLPAAGH